MIARLVVAGLMLLVAVAAADAQSYQPGPGAVPVPSYLPPTLPGSTNSILFNNGGLGAISPVNNAVLVTNGSGVPSEATTLPSGLTLPGAASYNGWVPNWGIADSSNGTPASGGTGNAAGDQLTLNDGCSTHGIVSVQAVAGGAVSTFVVVNRGTCTTIPTNPVSVLSSSGSGSGATFNLAYAPLSAGVLFGSLTNNQGNVFLGGETPNAGFASTESVFVGDRAGGNIVGSGGASSFNVAVGHNALGIGAGVTWSGGANTVIGTDAVRNVQGATANEVVIGTSAGRFLNGAVRDVIAGQGAATTNYATGHDNVLIGEGVAPTLSSGASNVIVGQAADIIAGSDGSAVIIGAGARGGQTDTMIGQAAGAAGTGNMLSVGVGWQSLNAVSSGTKFAAFGYQVGHITCKTGSNVLLLGTDSHTDCGSSGEANAIHIGAGAADVISATGTGTPSTSATTIAGTVTVSGITADTAHTDATVCEDTTSHQFYSGTGTLGVCLGTSSARFKHWIVGISAGLWEVMRLNAVNFLYRDGYGDNGRRWQYGFTAEQVAQVMPGLVHNDADGQPQSVDYLGLVPVLVRAIQTIGYLIASLYALIAVLAGGIIYLFFRMRRLEARLADRIYKDPKNVQLSDAEVKLIKRLVALRYPDGEIIGQVYAAVDPTASPTDAK